MDANSWDVHPVPLVDLQAADQVSLDGKAPLQLGDPTGKVAGETASHEVALLAGALVAEHLGGVLVPGRCTFLPASDLSGVVVGLTFINDHRLDSSVNSATMASMSRRALASK
jgi:hypothetical protein